MSLLASGNPVILSSKIKSGGCFLETWYLTLQRRKERLNVIFIPITGTGRNLGFGISSGLGNFEGDTIKEIATLWDQTEASIREGV